MRREEEGGGRRGMNEWMDEGGEDTDYSDTVDCNQGKSTYELEESSI